MNAFILVYGNPIDGLKFIGPFGDAEAATEYAEKYGIEADWWLTELESIQQFAKNQEE